MRVCMCVCVFVPTSLHKKLYSNHYGLKWTDFGSAIILLYNLLQGEESECAPEYFCTLTLLMPFSGIRLIFTILPPDG